VGQQEGTVDGFAPRDRAAVEYWFWKFHVGDLAFLVDFIVRRRAGVAEVRVSQWLRGVGRVIHHEDRDWTAPRELVRVGTSELRPGQSIGSAEDVSWDLRWTEGEARVTIPPGPLARLGPFDTTVIAWPNARFTGTVQVGSERFELADLAGTFSHYWGRRLADHWVWLSATSFERAPERRFEAIVAIRSRLFGRLPYPIPLGFVWTTDGRTADFVVSTVNGLVRSRAIEGGMAVVAQRLGGPRHHATATWGPIAPNDIGDEIIQTMHASLILDGARAVEGTVGLEERRGRTGRPGPS
jgi:hypothetical protein